jgi:hypothetical protein
LRHASSKRRYSLTGSRWLSYLDGRPMNHPAVGRKKFLRGRCSDDAQAVAAMMRAALRSEGWAMRSLCETCALMREVITPKGSRFLLCQLSRTNPAFPKYPPQPVVRCDGYQPTEKTEQDTTGGNG